MPLLQLSEVNLAYGHVPLLDHADLVVEPGEHIGLIGRNGTGKSSLLRVIEGRTRADDGKVWLAADLKVAMVEQEPALEAGQTVFEAVARGVGEARQMLLDYHAAASAGELDRMHALHEALDHANAWAIEHRIEATLDRLGLPADTRVDALSGGMRKRVALARALALEPEIVFLDEPTSGLDPINARAFDSMVRVLSDSLGLTVFIVTHDLDTLLSIIDRVIVLSAGKVIADGPVDRVVRMDEPWIREYFSARAPAQERA